MAKWALEKATGEEHAQMKALLEQMEDKWARCMLGGNLPRAIFVRAETLIRLQECAGKPEDLAGEDLTFRDTSVVGVMPHQVLRFGPIIVAREEDMPRLVASAGEDAGRYQYAPLGEWNCWLIAAPMSNLKPGRVA